MFTKQDQKRKFIKWLILLFWIGLFFQYLFSKNIQEPYPAIVFPAFSSIPTNSGDILMNKKRIYLYYSTNDSVKISKNELMPQQSISGARFKYVFRTIKRRQLGKSVVWNMETDLSVYKIEIRQKISVDTTRMNKFQNWIHSNISDIKKDKDIQKVKIFTYKYKYDFKNKQIKNHYEQIDQFTIKLNN